MATTVKSTKANHRPLAVVTGASSGIGYYLAKECAENGFDLLIAADDPRINDVARDFRALGTLVDAIESDLATTQGVDELVFAINSRSVKALLANAGHGLGHAFLDQGFEEARHVIDTNVTGTLYLIHKVGNEMRERGEGRILITGSIAGFMPGTYQAVYNGTKAFMDSFSFALREELKDSGVTVTCLMPGATETEFFERAVAEVIERAAFERLLESGRRLRWKLPSPSRSPSPGSPPSRSQSRFRSRSPSPSRRLNRSEPRSLKHLRRWRRQWTLPRRPRGLPFGRRNRRCLRPL